MEPFAKRQRLYNPRDSFFVHSFDDQHEYYETPDTEFEEDEEDEEDDEEVDEPIYDPEDELEQRRAQLDYKLKSTFEAIFDKYGKDFDGVGDEIDLATGEIVVDNGHLLEMRDERDEGDTGRGRTRLSAFSVEREDDLSSSLGDTILDEDEDDGEEEGEEDEDEELSDDDMIEDDMILRGFAQASQFLLAEPSPERSSSHTDSLEDSLEERRDPPGHFHKSNGHDSRSEILAQFGPQLGPQIVNYISQTGTEDDSSIEPAWRVPNIPIPNHGRRPVLKYAVRKPEIARSLSPDTAPSLWAPALPRGPRRKIRRENNTILKRKRVPPIGYYGTMSLDQFESGPVRKRPRNDFTAEDDKILLDVVTKARLRGPRVPVSTWKQLEAMRPQHTWGSWKKRYHVKFTYLLRNQFEASEVSTSETSNSDHHTPMGGFELNFTDSVRFQRPQPLRYQRPMRARKPAQRDSNIISWSEAVDTIESLDPVLHAGILEDVRNSGQLPETFRRPISSSNSAGQYQSSQDGEQLEQCPSVGNISRSSEPRIHNKPESIENLLPQHSQVPSLNFEKGRETASRTAPCPHTDCGPYPEVLYRLERIHEEEQSQMCLHLLRVHRTTPFPCGEIGCERTGVRGYFFQADLVWHVKIAHPYIAALHRLRGRVDSDLLAQSYNHTKSRSSIEAHRNSTPECPPTDSDFMTPRSPNIRQIQSCSQLVTSSPNLDQTMTPRGSSSRFEAASTEKTSVSSFTLNHSAAPANVARESKEFPQIFLISDELVDRAGASVNVRNGKNGNNNEKKHPSPLMESMEIEKTIPPTSPAQLCKGTHDGRAQRREPGLELTPRQSHVANVEPHLGDRNEILNSSVPTNSSLQKSKSPNRSIPNSQSSQEVIPSSPPLPLPRPNSSSRAVRVSAHLERNTIDPSYEFSDEEVVLDPVVMKPSPLSTQLPRGTPRPVSRMQSTSPAIEKKLQKSFYQTLDSEDFDELSLGCEDFVLISSHSKVTDRAPSSSQKRIKHEPVETPRRIPAATSQKRILGMAQDMDDLDELGAQQWLEFALLSSSSKSQSQIKTGTDKFSHSPASKLATTDIGQQGLGTKDHQRRFDGANSFPSSQLTSTPTTKSTLHRNQRRIVAPNTPMLGLTPNGNNRRKSQKAKKVNESAAVSSSSWLGSSPNTCRTESQKKEVGSDTSQTGVVSQAQENTEEEVALLVKTPGGTLRSCGEDGFSCGRSFCFKCSNA